MGTVVEARGVGGARAARTRCGALAAVVLLLSWLVGPGWVRVRAEGADKAGAPACEVRAHGPDHARARPGPRVKRGTIKRGETITSLLGEWLSAAEIDLLARQSEAVFPLRRLRAGQAYAIRTVGGDLKSFVYEISRDERLVVRVGAGGFAVRREPIEYEVDTVVVSGTIVTSLYRALEGIGEGPELAMRLVDILGWDVDFDQGIRKGDTFKVVAEKRYRGGRFAGYGRILAVEMVNQGRKIQAFLFRDGDGRPCYFDEKGRSLKRAFLRSPIHYARISSGFSWNRFHPVKKKWSPHPGIDYAAPVGTPVRSVGDGFVLGMGSNRYSGKYVRIRHNSIYETEYSHLSRFARGLRQGRRVREGEVIGYVGSTGMSTGPHLDFRMKRHGRYVDPREVRAPAAPPVPRKEIGAFRAAIRPLLAQLEAVEVPPARVVSGKPGPASGEGPGPWGRGGD